MTLVDCVSVPVILLVLIPGLRKHGILQKITSKVSGAAKSAASKAKKK